MSELQGTGSAHCKGTHPPLSRSAVARDLVSRIAALTEELDEELFKMAKEDPPPVTGWEDLPEDEQLDWLERAGWLIEALKPVFAPRFISLAYASSDAATMTLLNADGSHGVNAGLVKLPEEPPCQTKI